MDYLSLIASLVSLAAKAAPAAEQVYADGKALIQSLVDKGLISVEQQNQYMQWADGHMESVLTLPEPPEFIVDASTAALNASTTATETPPPPPAPPAASEAPAKVPSFGGSVSDLHAKISQS